MPSVFNLQWDLKANISCAGLEFKRITSAEVPVWRMVWFCLMYIGSTD